MGASKETEQKISQLQLIEQGLQNFNLQKQQLSAKILETESAIEELESTDTAYKIIGNLMVKVSKDKLKSELEEKKNNSTIRINALEKQEQSMREKAKRIQQEVLKEMQGNTKEDDDNGKQPVTGIDMLNHILALRTLFFPFPPNLPQSADRTPGFLV